MDFFQKAAGLAGQSIRNELTAAAIDDIIGWPNEELPTLFAAADGVRRAFFKNAVAPCTLMNIKSGGCSEDCAFCSQSARHATNVPVTPLASAESIRQQAREAEKNGLPFCVVSSGRRLKTDEIKMIADAIAPCSCEKHASLGILDDEDFALLKQAGVVCYNHNLETSRSFFPTIVTTHSFDDRIATVKKAKAAGMSVCCGGIFGLGETWGQRKEFCLELKALDVDTVPINFIIPVPGTRARPPKETALDFLKIVALFRLAMPSKTIKICGGREVNLGALQPLIFYAGANGYVTGGYLTTAGAGLEKDDAMIKALGLLR